MSDAALAGAVAQLLGVAMFPGSSPRILVVDRRAVDRPRKVSRGPAPGRVVVVHQLGCELGVARTQSEAAGGDVLEARIRRAMGTPYHVVALLAREGTEAAVVMNHPASLRMGHASKGNGGIGVGIEGNYPTRAGGPLKRSTKIADAIDVGRASLRMAVALAGGGDVEVQAHRQWSRDRTRDPGEEVWREIVLPVVAELGLRIRYEPIGPGRPIPREWDPSATHDLTGRPV